ncbi:MAG: PQQ-binding-like beta-propeller repeat protein [Planctomycetota bacterium]|nr:PQQ-binding-like beta-propeller repeat protein [Planctomycetota bacterium]
MSAPPLLKPICQLSVLIVFCAANAAAGGLTEEVLQLSGVGAGVCVWLEPGECQSLAELARGRTFLVHGICSETKSAAAARQRLAGEGLAGIASVEALPLNPLPHANNLVNLLVAEDLAALLKKGLTLAEILRALCPNGVACLGVPPEQNKDLEARLAEAAIKDFRFERKSRLWLVFKKPRPAGMDDWTHWNHAPDGSLVSRDQLIERPNQMQWIAGPHWGNHRGLYIPGAGSASGVLSVNGRNYYLIGSQFMARDAFNGVPLWHQVIKGLDHRLVVASGNEVYLCRTGELVALAGATGKDVRSYGKTEGCHALILMDGLLLSFEPKSLRAFEAATGKELWASPDGGSAGAPVAAGGKVFFMRGGLACIGLADGKLLWKRDVRGLGDIAFAFSDKLLLCADGFRYTALSSEDGAEAWSYTAKKPVGRSPESYFASGLVWVQSPDDRDARKTDGFHNPKGGEAYKWDGLDPATGAVRRSLLAPVTLGFRCHALFATDRFLVANRPIYFTDWKDGSVTRFEATRMACGGTCGLGQGMFFGLYTDSNQCMCIRHALSGISAYASDGKTIDGAVKTEEDGRLEKGPAASLEAPAAPPADQWPMYRCDLRRTGCVPGSLPAKLTVAWKKTLLADWKNTPHGEVLHNDWLLNKVSGDPVTQPVIAEGKVFVSLTHAQQVVALHDKTGETAWTFHAPSRLDAPPTIYRGLCLIGCHDGWVYCLRSDDGQMVWRFRAAPAERRMVAYGQIESAWPVVDGVLLVGDLGYVVAGRTTETDGGLYVHALDLKTGKPVWSERRVKPDDGPIGGWNLRGLSSTYFGPSDLLCSDGKTVAISGHSRGHFDCKSGGTSDRSFGGHHFGWMQSRYSADNQHMDYPPRVYYGSQTVYPATARDVETKKSSRCIVMSGRPGWKTELPDGPHIVEALAAVGNVGSEKSAPSVACPIVRVRTVDTPPKVDGEIDDLYRDNAVPLNFSFLDGGKGKPKEATTCYILSDAENLYLAFRCEKADPDKVICTKTRRDDDVWQDECVEFFIDPQNTREKKYFHIIVNPAGITQEARVSDTSWNPELTVKCGKEKGKAWIAEVKIPFKELELKGGKPSHVWSLNLNRSARNPTDAQAVEDTAWSRTYSNSSHVPEMFGYMWLDALEGGRDEAAFAAWSKSIAGPAESARTPDAAAKADGCSAVLAALSRGGPDAAGGELWVLSARDGTKLGTHGLPAAPAFEGLAVAGGKVCVVLQDGTIVCLK